MMCLSAAGTKSVPNISKLQNHSRRETEINYVTFCSSMSDEEFVVTAIVSLLKDRGFRICYHREDFTPGQWIGDNIADAMEKSRRMIFIVSRYECIVCLNITIIFTHNLEWQGMFD